MNLPPGWEYAGTLFDIPPLDEAPVRPIEHHIVKVEIETLPEGCCFLCCTHDEEHEYAEDHDC